MTGRPQKPKVLISSSQKAMRTPRKRLDSLVRFVATKERLPLVQIDLAVVTRRQIAALNRKYCRHAGATDVLCFDLAEPGCTGICAQIVVCGEIAAAEARRRGTGPQRELMLYVVHALLHLCGYDDAAAGAAKMHSRQEQLLLQFLRTKRKAENRKLRRTQRRQ